MRLKQVALGLASVLPMAACGGGDGAPTGNTAAERTSGAGAVGRNAASDTAEVRALKAVSEMRDNVAATQRGIKAGQQPQEGHKDR